MTKLLTRGLILSSSALKASAIQALAILFTLLNLRLAQISVQSCIKSVNTAADYFWILGCFVLSAHSIQLYYGPCLLWPEFYGTVSWGVCSNFRICPHKYLNTYFFSHFSTWLVILFLGVLVCRTAKCIGIAVQWSTGVRLGLSYRLFRFLNGRPLYCVCFVFVRGDSENG